jgi:hypothetical protein
MSAAMLLQDLTQQGVELWVEGEKLRYRGSRKVITPDVLAQLKERKLELLAELNPDTPSSDTSSDTVNGQHPLDCPCLDCSVRAPMCARSVEHSGQVLEMAREYFGPVEDPVILPAPPGRDPLVAKTGAKVEFFRGGGGWRDVSPVDFKVYRGGKA